MPPRIKTISALKEIKEILKIHDEAWNHSTGILGLLKNSSECFIVLDNNSLIVGYAFVEEDRIRGFVELQDIVISPSYRKQGYGKLLMKTIMKKYSYIKLIARANNQSLISFYQDLGFNKDSLIENYYDVGEDGIRMSWQSDKNYLSIQPGRKND
ncbi:MAG: GNAT family N-acetyltransferase [Candidatus Aminicenantes bacterium]|nr:GNAT family N-acetyltransferase [Candidatus Aminicenantes bacterium]